MLTINGLMQSNSNFWLLIFGRGLLILTHVRTCSNIQSIMSSNEQIAMGSKIPPPATRSKVLILTILPSQGRLLKRVVDTVSSGETECGKHNRATTIDQ